MDFDVYSRLILFATRLATWGEMQPFCDQFLQRSDDALAKGLPGPAGQKACARHVASHTLSQLAAELTVTTVLGYRLPPRAWLAGAAINALTHYAIDRREPFIRLLRGRWPDKGEYLDRATVQRREGVVDTGGPGTALMELDQAAHRCIAVAACLVSTWLATRPTATTTGRKDA